MCGWIKVHGITCGRMKQVRAIGVVATSSCLNHLVRNAAELRKYRPRTAIYNAIKTMPV